MHRISAFLVAVVSMFGSITYGQVGFGVRQQNVTTGGSLTVGGVVNPSRTGVRLGVDVGFSQLVDVHTFTFNTAPVPAGFIGGGFGVGFGGGFAGATNGGVGFPGSGVGNAPLPQNRPPTVGQFMLTAFRYDEDKNTELNRDELGKIGKAVVDELQKRSGGPTYAKGSAAAQKLTEQKKKMVDAFVTRSMQFDADADDSLDKTETKQMATALIRSMLTPTPGRS